MGRKPSNPGAVPRLRIRKRGDAEYFFYDHGGTPRREEALGKDYGKAIHRWAELEREAKVPTPLQPTFRFVAEAYAREVIPTKADRTQADNKRELANLVAFFDDPPCPFESIKPGDVMDYLRWRKSAKVRAQREKALLSHLWNWARGERYTDLPNPCAGIKAGKQGKGRADVYLEDEDFLAVWEAGSATLRDAMDLAYLTGQRPADVLRMAETDVREVLKVQQGKTGKRLRFDLSDALLAILARVRARKAAFKVHNTRLVVNEWGRPIGVNALSRHWKAACDAIGLKGYQFRDIRAKSGTDKRDATGSADAAQAHLGHDSARMTEHYLRNRKGARVAPNASIAEKARRIAEKPSR